MIFVKPMKEYSKWHQIWYVWQVRYDESKNCVSLGYWQEAHYLFMMFVKPIKEYSKLHQIWCVWQVWYAEYKKSAPLSYWQEAH